MFSHQVLRWLEQGDRAEKSLGGSHLRGLKYLLDHENLSDNHLVGLYCVAALYFHYIGSGFYAFQVEVPLGGFIYFLSQGVIDFRLYVLAAFDDDVAVVVPYR